MKQRSVKKIVFFLIGQMPTERLVKVCAWCPKSSYPELNNGQEYTHGLCRRHYAKLTAGKKVTPLLTIIAISIITLLNKIDARLAVR